MFGTETHERGAPLLPPNPVTEYRQNTNSSSARRQEECIILGSGESILNLSPAEKEYLQAHPNTVGMNKYLLFYEKIGVLPKFVFLADTMFPVPKLVVDLLRKSRHVSSPPVFLLQECYRSFIERPGMNYRALRRYLGQRVRLCREHRYWFPLFLPRPKAIYFHSQPDLNGRPFFWAKTLKDEMFYHRGSLTTLINLVTVYFDVVTIKLVGIDLNTSSSFYAQETSKLKKYWNAQNAVEQHAGMSITAIPYRGFDPIQAVFPAIVKQLHREGKELICCNPKSLLCEEGLCKFGPVIPLPNENSTGRA